MEIRLLRYFIAVANQQSISAAAQHLHLSQPSLSRQLSEFEKELGTVLFIRGNRKIYIGGGETDAMRLIAKTLKSLLKDYPNIEFHLFSGNADDITDKLDSGVLDFGIVIEPTDKQRYDYIKLPATDVWGVLMRKDSLLADKPFIQPSDLI